MFIHFFKKIQYPSLPSVQKIYETCIEKARSSYYFDQCGVPDTLSGRLSVLMLQTLVQSSRLCDAGHQKSAQLLVDLFFMDIEQNLRQTPIGDLSIPKYMKKIKILWHGYQDVWVQTGGIHKILINQDFFIVNDPEKFEKYFLNHI